MLHLCNCFISVTDRKVTESLKMYVLMSIILYDKIEFGSTHLPTKSLSEVCALGTIFSSSGSIQVKKQRVKEETTDINLCSYTFKFINN